MIAPTVADGDRPRRVCPDRGPVRPDARRAKRLTNAARLLAGVVAGLVAWRTRNVTVTFLAGMAALWLLSWTLRGAAG